MRKFFGFSTAAVAVACACSTSLKTQEPPPFSPPQVRVDDVDERDPVSADQNLEKRLIESPSESLRLLTRYRQAAVWSASEPAKGCGIWTSLANESRFPLAEVARLRALETCPQGQGQLPSIDDALSSTPAPWLSEAQARAGLKRALNTKNTDWEMRLSAEVARFEKLQRDRVRLLQRSIELAKEKKDDSLAKEFETRLAETAPRFNVSPKPEQYMRVANDFRQVREFEKARGLYKKITDRKDGDDLEKLRALDAIRMTYKLEKNTESFLKATEDYAKFARARFFKAAKGRNARELLGHYFDAQITLARAVWTEHKASEARDILTRLERDVKGRYPIEESLFIRARIAEEAGRHSETLRILERADLEKMADRGLRDKLLWYRAWNLRKAGRLKEAAENLERLSRDEQTPSLLARDRYWLGRTYKDLKNEDKAREEFQWLISNDPLGYYGLLAYRELKRPLPPFGDVANKIAVETSRDLDDGRTPAAKENSETSSPSPVLSLSGAEREKFEWLILAKENELARLYLDHTSADRRSGFNDAQLTDLLQLYAQAGNYIVLFARISELPAAVRQRIVDTRPDLLFPQPWKPLVLDASRKFNVPAELIYSIMRQESSFNPTARSIADAFGLMQLIPEMAKRAGTKTGIEIRAHEDLYRPETNIPLGAAFLRGLFEHWNNQFVLSVASYNASEKAIAGWLRTRFKGDPLEFIEDVPYEETKTYIKLVLRNFVFYSRLNSGGTPIEFPEWCLENLQAIKP